MATTKIKLIAGQKLPRMICLGEMTKENYRALQAGDEVSVPVNLAKYLVDCGFCEFIAEKKGTAKDGTNSID